MERIKDGWGEGKGVEGGGAGVIIKCSPRTYMYTVSGHLPLSLVHEVKGLVDVSQGHGVGRKFIDFDLASQVVLH